MVCGSSVLKTEIQFMRTAKQTDWQADRCRLCGIQADPQLALTAALQEQVAHADTLHTGQVIRVMSKLKRKLLLSGEYTRSVTKKTPHEGQLLKDLAYSWRPLNTRLDN